MQKRKYWAVSDGNGGYDIGVGDVTTAHVRNVREQDGAKAAALLPDGYDVRAEALRFKASAEMLAALQTIAQYDGLTDRPTNADWAEVRNAIARATGKY